MPIQFWRESGCVIVTFEGTYDAQAGLAVIDEALRAESGASGLLLDLSDSMSFRTRSAEDLRGIAAFLSTRRSLFHSRLATVASSDLAYGLLRMGTVFSSDQGIDSAAFRSRDEAVAWLCTEEGV